MKCGVCSFLLVCSISVIGSNGIGINVRNIDDECGKIPAPITVGTSLPSVIIQRNRGSYKRPCAVRLEVITDSLTEQQFKFYVKVVTLNLPKTVEGECYHWLLINGLDVPGFGVEMCGEIAENKETGFVSVEHDIDVHWNASKDTDPVLTKQGLNDGFFRVVITVFTEASPVLGCPDADDPRRPETAVKYHHCNNNRCIDEGLRCNRFNNCGDKEASDEQNCTYDTDGGILYIIIGIVMGGLSFTLILIYLVFYMDCGGEDDQNGAEDLHDEEEGVNLNVEDDSSDEYVTAPPGTEPEAKNEESVDRSEIPTSRPSAIVELETINEGIQEEA